MGYGVFECVLDTDTEVFNSKGETAITPSGSTIYLSDAWDDAGEGDTAVTFTWIDPLGLAGDSVEDNTYTGTVSFSDVTPSEKGLDVVAKVIAMGGGR